MSAFISPETNRLATNTTAESVVNVEVADIVTRADWQVRVKVDGGTVQNYASEMRAGAAFPPLRIARIDGALYLVDGWHRLEAARVNGESSVGAVVSDMTEAEAQWAAAQANLTHGLPLKPREVREVFRAYVRSKQHRKGTRRAVNIYARHASSPRSHQRCDSLLPAPSPVHMHGN